VPDGLYRNCAMPLSVLKIGKSERVVGHRTVTCNVLYDFVRDRKTIKTMHIKVAKTSSISEVDEYVKSITNRFQEDSTFENSGYPAWYKKPDPSKIPPSRGKLVDQLIERMKQPLERWNIYTMSGITPFSNPPIDFNDLTLERETIGTMSLMRRLGYMTGLTDLLDIFFKEDGERIFNCASFFAATSDPTMYCWRFMQSNNIEKKSGYSPPALSSFIKKLGSDEALLAEFMLAWVKMNMKDDDGFLVWDGTDLPFDGKSINMAKLGLRKDGTYGNKINLSMLSSIATMFPLYYEINAGNIIDVSTLAPMADLLCSGITDRILRIILDRGFDSKANIDMLVDINMEFLMMLKSGSKRYAEVIELFKDEITLPENTISVCGENLQALEITWNYSKEKVLKLFLYKDPAAAVEQEIVFYKKLNDMLAIAEQNPEDYIDNKEYKYFKFKKYKNGKCTVSLDHGKIKDYVKTFGMFMMASNCMTLTKITALETYRTRDRGEKNFLYVKTLLKRNRIRTHSEASMRGAMFLSFISLILTTSLMNIAKQSGLFSGKIQTLHDIYLEMSDHITYILNGNRKLSPIRKEQRIIYNAIGIDTCLPVPPV